MTERDKLQSLINDGFRAHMILRDVPSDEQVRRLPSVMHSVDIKALPLWHSDGRKIMFYMQSPETILFAEQLVTAAKEIIGYSPCVYLCAIGASIVNGRTMHLEKVAKTLTEIHAWEVRETKHPSVLAVRSNIHGSDYGQVQVFVENVNKAALALSLINKHGFVVKSFSPGERFKGQPFALKFGPEERLATGVTAEAIASLEKVWTDEKCRIAADGLQAIYSQVSISSRILTGFSAIEDIFRGKPEHILSEEEQSDVLNAIDQIASLKNSPLKIKKLTDVVKNANYMATHTRNERIAHSISELLGRSYEEVVGIIRDISNLRGKHAHTIQEDSNSVGQELEFIEEVLWAEIRKYQPSLSPPITC